MNKRVFIVLLLGFVLMLSVILSNFALGKEPNAKVSSQVINEIKNNGKARVIVTLKNNNFDSRGILKISALNERKGVIESIGKDKIKHEFQSFNGFSARLSAEEIEELEQDDRVESIVYDSPVRAFLSDSVGIVNATATWKTQIKGINLTGQGETICIIDTGVNYSHESLGACQIKNLSSEGNIENLSSPVESPHPYEKNYDFTWNITMPGFEKIAVHFTNISTEAHYDYVIIYDSQNNTIAVYSGFHEDLWTPSVEGDTIYVRLVTDENVTDYGFYIDKAINGTANTTYNWSSCNKIINGWDVYNSDADPYDDEGHGTHVSGIVAANGSIKGVAPDAKIVMVKALGSDGGGYSSDVIKGIEWCTENSKEYNISVISMSLGTDCSLYPEYCYSSYCDIPQYFYKNPINNAVKKNISVVAASGNDGNTVNISSPACIKNATAVGATKKDDTIASYSNRNNITDLFAPGSNIVSTSIDGGSTNMGGTSMATPHVAAAFAIVRQFYKLEKGRVLTPAEIQDVLNDTGKIISDAGGSGLNFSRIDIYSAILGINEAPQVSFLSPENKTYDTKQILINITNSSDAVYIWWNNGTDNLTYFQPIYHNFSEGNHTIYAWANDTFGNVSFTSVNFSVELYSVKFTNPSLESGFYSLSEIWANATAGGFDEGNVTLTIWLYNASEITNYSSTNLTSLFVNFTNLAEGAYYINATANNSEGTNASSETRTIVLDRTSPVITLVSPDDDYETDDTTPSFTFKVNDANNIVNCSLLIDNEIKDTETSITKNEEETLTSSSLSADEYNWKIVCYDVAGNFGSSNTYDLTITEEEEEETESSSSESDNGDEGMFEYEGMTYNISKVSLINGTSKKLKENDKLYFKIKSIEHKLTVMDIKSDYAKIKIESNPITLKMYVGNETKLNLDDDDYLDLYIKLNEIKYLVANFTLQEIHEKSAMKDNALVSSESEQTEQSESNWKEMLVKSWQYIKTRKWRFIVGGVAFIVLIIVIGIAYYMKKHHLKLKVVCCK